jgi:hypothetical protein
MQVPDADVHQAFRVLELPRARRVHQSFWTAPFTTLYSLLWCLWHIVLLPSWSGQPFADLLLLNGPGTCVPIAYSAFLLRVSYSIALAGILTLDRSSASDRPS